MRVLVRFANYIGREVLRTFLIAEMELRAVAVYYWRLLQCHCPPLHNLWQGFSECFCIFALVKLLDLTLLNISDQVKMSTSLPFPENQNRRWIANKYLTFVTFVLNQPPQSGGKCIPTFDLCLYVATIVSNLCKMWGREKMINYAEVALKM